MIKWRCPVKGCNFEEGIPDKLDVTTASIYCDRIVRHFHSHTIEELFVVYLNASKTRG